MWGFNEDIRKENMEQWRNYVSMCEVMLDGLGEETAPSTYDKGKSPIDLILCSANIGMVKAGYLPFGEGAGDHRPLVIDIDQISVFGASENPSSKVKTRRLKLNDLRIRKKYDKIQEKVVELNAILIKYPMQPAIAVKYEAIDKIREECMTHAEKMQKIQDRQNTLESRGYNVTTIY